MGNKVLDIQMHTIAPIVMWIGRYIDTLGIRIWETNLLIDR
jgi:hypothetical protein